MLAIAGIASAGISLIRQSLWLRLSMSQRLLYKSSNGTNDGKSKVEQYRA